MADNSMVDLEAFVVSSIIYEITHTGRDRRSLDEEQLTKLLLNDAWTGVDPIPRMSSSSELDLAPRLLI